MIRIGRIGSGDGGQRGLRVRRIHCLPVSSVNAAWSVMVPPTVPLIFVTATRLWSRLPVRCRSSGLVKNGCRVGYGVRGYIVKPGSRKPGFTSKKRMSGWLLPRQTKNLIRFSCYVPPFRFRFRKDATAASMSVILVNASRSALQTNIHSCSADGPLVLHKLVVDPAHFR